ncbi:MAG TPA: cobalamin-dependent protein [Phycisphaerales bacterium]|nr:cobalamin-dependent protein [Phycisphaerales bacterium]
MSQDINVERLLEALIAGDRTAARDVVDQARKHEADAQGLLMNLYWPAHETIEKLFRSDTITQVSYHMATRLLRMLVDQACGELKTSAPNGKTIFAFSGKAEGEELAGQMACDLLESAGFQVAYCGGGIPADEILSQVQTRRPDYLVFFSSQGSDLPGIRGLVDTLREINAVPTTRIAVGGGVFNRAEGLAEEIGIHLVATTPLELVELLTSPFATEDVVEERKAKPASANRKRAAKALTLAAQQRREAA